MNTSEKYTFLENLSSKYDKQEYEDSKELLFLLSHDRSALIRGMVAELGADYRDSFMRDILLTLSHDRDKMVRVQATDSLCVYNGEEVFDRLAAMCGDDYYMVRAYAALSLAEVGNDEINRMRTIQIVKNTLKMERRRFNRIFCCEALYCLGDKSMLDELLSLYSGAKYTDQCAVVNCMKRIIDEDNRRHIIHFFEEKIKTCDATAVKSCIEELLARQ